ncbi:MAG: protein-glutamate O-methyltransferase CheR [Acidobacteriaceae bacterium]|nr:protein-glutamate O-methyltransferase CheR [Acidobacteriaceae bacterium]
MGCSDSDYAYLRQLVFTQSANRIDRSRNALFETRLTPIARMAGVSDLKDLVSILRDDPAPQLRHAVAEAMTINETSFFRDGKPFDVLRDTILPDLIQRNFTQRRLRIWSAASSTGQEAYSLAMLFCEHFPQIGNWDIKIIGTDISRHVIDYAQRGRYRRLEVNRGLPARMLVKYLVRDVDEWEVTPKLRALCSFQYANLCAPLPKLPIFDLILLRNVLLYFSPQDRSGVFSDVYRLSTPGGYLMLGAAEQAEDSTDLFQSEFAKDCYFYRPTPSPSAISELL